VRVPYQILIQKQLLKCSLVNSFYCASLHLGSIIVSLFCVLPCNTIWSLLFTLMCAIHRDVDSVIARANDTEYGLASGVFTKYTTRPMSPHLLVSSNSRASASRVETSVGDSTCVRYPLICSSIWFHCFYLLIPLKFINLNEFTGLRFTSYMSGYASWPKPQHPLRVCRLFILVPIPYS